MTESSQNSKVTLIIPAFNEERRISNVLRVVSKTQLIDEVIVVDDGSNDRTAAVATSYGAKVINHPCNRGKGAAMKTGINAAAGEILVFLDADLIGLAPLHLQKLVVPLLSDAGLVMTRGQFRGGRLQTDFAQIVAPSISGQRAVRKDFIASMPGLEKTRYGVEVAITKYCKQKKVKFKDVVLKDLTQVVKEEKEGYVKGLQSRARMYRDIAVQLTPQKKPSKPKKSNR